CRLEAKAVNIACLGRFIRSLRVHVPLSLTVPASRVEYHGERDRVSILVDGSHSDSTSLKLSVRSSVDHHS
ncbi:MAG: hypothetical protein OEU36_10300, partial [Gammaproteobacteria bacterium]|nr:hypothetical protein [Gammaproteobacteria bacterium]